MIEKIRVKCVSVSVQLGCRDAGVRAFIANTAAEAITRESERAAGGFHAAAAAASAREREGKGSRRMHKVRRTHRGGRTPAPPPPAACTHAHTFMHSLWHIARARSTCRGC